MCDQADGGPVAAVQLAGQAASVMAQSAAIRASLSGVSAHEKLVAQGTATNAFLFDEKRLARMRVLAGAPGPEAMAHTAP